MYTIIIKHNIILHTFIILFFSNKKGKEIITRYTVNTIASDNTFYTDSNGREMLQRIRNQRPTFNISLEEPVAGNYYPITTRIMMKDSENQMSVITDRAQGGSSITDGQVELMVSKIVFICFDHCIYTNFMIYTC